jgi:C4-dicarboxylate-specific signal transduction histidine kinase
MIHASLGDFERSLDYLNDALQVATEINLREIERDIYKGFSETYERMGDFENALGFHKRFKEIDETLFDADTSRRLAELETRFEVGKKDREIEVLRKDREIQRIVRNVTLAGAFVLIVLVVLLYNRYRLKTRADREIRKRNEAQQLAQAEREKAARAELLHVSRVATMGELASALAHELNQPLTAILSNTQATRRLLASGRGRPAELDEALGDIVDGADRAREIIQRLRALMRRGDVTLEPLDVNETLRSVEAFARADARESETDLVMNFAPDLPVVRGDRIQIQQVLLNLVHNGTEAMAAAGGDRRALVVRTSLYDPETVMVAVQDTGPPLDDNVVSRMFEPFFTTKSAGMGMGLPICRTIIEAHGGRLWAVRNPDRGLTVQFTLPRASE